MLANSYQRRSFRWRFEQLIVFYIHFNQNRFIFHHRNTLALEGGHFYIMLVLPSFRCRADTAWTHLKRASHLRHSPGHIGGVQACPWGSFWFANWCWRALPTVGTTSPRQVVLGYMTKVAGSDQQCSSMVSVSSSCPSSCFDFFQTWVEPGSVS